MNFLKWFTKPSDNKEKEGDMPRKKKTTSTEPVEPALEGEGIFADEIGKGEVEE